LQPLPVTLFMPDPSRPTLHRVKHGRIFLKPRINRTPILKPSMEIVTAGKEITEIEIDAGNANVLAIEQD